VCNYLLVLIAAASLVQYAISSEQLDERRLELLVERLVVIAVTVTVLMIVNVVTVTCLSPYVR
jgi:hypothetical protein